MLRVLKQTNNQKTTRVKGTGLIAGIVLIAALVGCASYRGSKLYVEGTEALFDGQVKLAVERLEAAAQLVPQSSEIQNHLGIAYLVAGRPVDARQALQEAHRLDCRNPAAIQNLQQLEKRHER